MIRLFWFTMLLMISLGVAAKDPEIVQIAPDTYLISAEDHRGIFGNAASMKAKVIRQANEFAAKQGKIAVAISTSETPLGRGPAQWARFEYQFRVVSPNDPEATRTSLKPVSDVTVTVENRDAGSPPPSGNSTESLYSKLIELDDLRQRGILTQQEFDEAKARILQDE